jgi:hypothetical protein
MGFYKQVENALLDFEFGDMVSNQGNSCSANFGAVCFAAYCGCTMA